jgi:hypothetical protein
MPTALRLLAELERLLPQFGSGHADRKFALLHALDARKLPTAEAVQRLHEALCFLRAYPDDQALLDKVVVMLDRFDLRPDLVHQQKRLADTGIAGTALHYSFYADTARWLCTRFPGALEVDWRDYRNEALLLQRLPLFAQWSETPALDELDWSAAEWVRRLAGADSDADFLIRGAAALPGSDAMRETFFEELELDFVLRPVPGAPSRSRAVLPGRPVHFVTAPLRRERPDLRQAVRYTAAEQPVDAALAAQLVTLAREAMVLRHRDLDAFAYADPRDVRLFDAGDGLEFAVFGMQPERRLLLESVYAFLTLKNGVPIGYVLVSALFGSSEVAYNVFEPWRGGEAGHIYGRVLALTRQLFGSDTFTVYPYQLGGDGNDEGLASGAYWFYAKLGFAARDPEQQRLHQAEVALLRRRPTHRSSKRVLAALAAHNVYWSLGKPRDDVIGVFPLAQLGLAATDLLARRFGADRSAAEAACAGAAAVRCGVRDWQKWDDGERLAFVRWAPLLLALPGLERWSPADRRAAAEVARAKGSRRESDYVQALDRHRPLRRALVALAKTAR